MNFYTPIKASGVPANLDGFSATNVTEARLHQTQQPNALPASWRCPGQPGILWEVFPFSIPASFSVMAATTQAMSQEFGTTSKAFKAFHSFVRSGEANGDHIETTVPIPAQNRHHLPHLPVLRTGKAVLPGIHHRCCNSHFGSQVKRGHSVLAELHLNPVCHRFHLHRQGVRLCLFPCF